MKKYRVVIELYNDDGKYKADYFEQCFNNIEHAFNYSYVIINEIINDKQLDYKSIKILEDTTTGKQKTSKIINELRIKRGANNV